MKTLPNATTCRCKRLQVSVSRTRKVHYHTRQGSTQPIRGGPMARSRVLRTLFVLVLVVLCVPSLFAQQTGAVRGRVTASDGSALPGVTIEARSPVLPQPRVTTTDGNGDYRLPALVPGTYTLTFSLSGMQSATRKAEVILGQEITADSKLGVQGVSETV